MHHDFELEYNVLNVYGTKKLCVEYELTPYYAATELNSEEPARAILGTILEYTEDGLLQTSVCDMVNKEMLRELSDEILELAAP